jgi:DNA polymerase
VENVTQAAARDVLAGNMPLIEDAGYSIVLTVHDEVITEAPDTDDFNDKALSALLSTNPEWGSRYSAERWRLRGVPLP